MATERTMARERTMTNGNVIDIASGPKYPMVKVQLVGPYAGFTPTVTAVQSAMRRAGVPDMELSNFYQDATTADEGQLLRTCLRWVDVEVR